MGRGRSRCRLAERPDAAARSLFQRHQRQGRRGQPARHAPASYWRWDDVRERNRKGFFPYTSSTNLLYGLREAIKIMTEDEGLDNVFARHKRHAEATRRAVRRGASKLS